MTEHHDTTMDSPNWHPGARVGTHWATCWRDGGRRHHECAIARVEELEAQIAQVEAATVAAMHDGDYTATHPPGVILPEDPKALYARIAAVETRLAAEKQENARMRMYIEELCKRLKRAQVLDAADAAKARAQEAGLWGKPAVQP